MEDLKNIILNLKSVIDDNENILPGDIEIFQNLLKELRTQLQIKLFSHLVLGNQDYKALSHTLDRKIKEYSQELAKIKENQKDKIGAVRQQEILQRFIASLNNLKKELESQDIVKASSHIFDDYKMEELIDNCTASLALGYMDFEPLFGKNLFTPTTSVSHNFEVDFDLVKKVTDIIKQKELHEELIAYSDSIMDFDKAENNLKKNEEVLSLLNKLEPNIEDLTNLYKYTLLQKQIIDKGEQLRKKIMNLQEQLQDKQKSKISRILNSTVIDNLEKELAIVEQDADSLSRDYIKLKTSIEQVMSKLRLSENTKAMVEFAQYINVDGSTSKDYEYTGMPEQIVFEELLKKISNYTKYHKILEKYETRFDESKRILESKKKVKDDLYNNLSIPAKAYADEDIYSTREAINIINRQSRYSCTPVICTFILRIIGESKKISLEELESVVNSYSDISIEDLTNEYEGVISRYIENINTEITNIEEDYNMMFAEVDDNELESEKVEHKL